MNSNAIDINRSHSSTLTAQIGDWIEIWGNKGFASVASALRSKKVAEAIARIETVGLSDHFAFVEILSGKHEGRVVATIGFEKGAPVPIEAQSLAMHFGILVFSAR